MNYQQLLKELTAMGFEVCAEDNESRYYNDGNFEITIWLEEGIVKVEETYEQIYNSFNEPKSAFNYIYNLIQ